MASGWIVLYRIEGTTRNNPIAAHRAEIRGKFLSKVKEKSKLHPGGKYSRGAAN